MIQVEELYKNLFGLKMIIRLGRENVVQEDGF